MKGYPKKLNTKEDYEYVRENFDKEKWEQDWQNLLDTMKDWIPIQEISSIKGGIEDETHKIIYDPEEDTFTQFELQEIPTCKLYQLGFTENYVKSILEQQ